MLRNNYRTLFNADAATFFYPEIVERFQSEDDRYSPDTIYRYVETLADADIDTLLVNPNTQVAWYPSEAVPTAFDEYKQGNDELFQSALAPPDTDRTGKANPNYEATFDVEYRTRLFDAYVDLAEAGKDWLAETTRACRQAGIEPWLSIRMNDMHGAHDPEISFLTAPVFDESQNRLSGETIFPREASDSYQQALNYGTEAVREYMFTLIEEVVKEYNFAGIELDWLRNPLCCEPPASDDTVATMTEWISDVRTLVDAQDGPYPLGLRTPADLRLLREIGLDVSAMADRELIDFVAPSNFWQTTWALPYDQMREHVGGDVAIYGVVENAPNFVHGYDPEGDVQGVRFLGASPELLRGNAAGKIAANVDGIELFNFFCTDVIGARRDQEEMRCAYDALADIDELVSLRGCPKQYTLSTWMPIGRRVYEGEGDFDHTMPFNLPEQLPAVIESGMRRKFRLSMAAEPEGCTLDAQVVLDADFHRNERTPPVGVSFNGSWPTFDATQTDELLFPTGPYTKHVDDYRTYEFRLERNRLVDGWNDLVVYNGHPSTKETNKQSHQSVRVISIEFAVQ